MVVATTNTMRSSLAGGALAVALLAIVVSSSSNIGQVHAQEETTGTLVVDERSVLLELYRSTGGHAWNENYGWESNLDEMCDWHGVICIDDDATERSQTSQGQGDTNRENGGGGDDEERRRRQLQSQGQIIGLKLDANFLVGRTPASLWSLPSLQYVDFSYNPNLDVDFVSLSSLTSTGSSSSSSSKIKELHLRQTATTSTTGLAAVKNTLQILNLSENSINTQFPPDLYELTKLTILEMAECNLQGTLPESISQLSSLKEINFYRNSLTGTLPDGLSRLVHLRHLGLSLNQFHGTLPSYLNNMVMLEQLWLANNDFTGAIPSFANSPDIFKVFVNGNSLSGEMPVDFLQSVVGGPNTRPITINLSHNEFTGLVPTSIDNLSSLEMTWKIGDNKWTGIPDNLCDNVNWNSGNIEEFGCFGLACPPGSYSRLGYQTSEGECVPCESIQYYGATNCFDKDDESILRELFIATDGERWDRNDGWLKTSNVCEWFGIRCYEDTGDVERDGRVRWVTLPNNGLKGNVPDTFWGLEHLTTVDLSRNDIVVSFEYISESETVNSVNVAATLTKDYDGIEDANPSFHRLYADKTAIGGTIPREIFGLTNLEVLSLQECNLNGRLPQELFDGMTSLEELYLTNNNFSGDIPDRWDSLPSLEIVALAKNKLKGPLPPTFDTAASLLAVSLQDQVSKGGGLTGTVPAYATTRTLAKLVVAENKLDGELPEDLLASIDGMVPLTVDLTNNMITGNVHGSWERFSKLDLYLEGNQIASIDEGLCDNNEWMSGSVASFGCNAILCPAGTVGGRQQFTDENCQVCSSGDASPRAASYLGQLSCVEDVAVAGERAILELMYNQMGGSGWRNSDNWLSNTGVCAWYGIDCDENGSVSSIQLGSNQLVGTFPTEVYHLPQLQHLKLHSNTVYMSFEGIEQAENLQTLSLDSTGLGSLEGIGQARSLRELSVSRNILNGPIPEEFSRLINLETLDLSFNGLSGFLPYWFRGLVSLTTFTASNNKFSGPLSDFGALRELRYLDLSFNELTGSIPETLLSLAPSDDKVVVDLSHNKIGGAVPAEISRMKRLSLQLQDNRIEQIDAALCDVEGINDYDVLSFGCNGILCPAGSYNSLGRQSSEDLPCSPCDKAQFMGATHCGKSDASSRGRFVNTAAIVGINAALAWLLV
eukprot:CAMPEP_0113507458 /NCGR_PEP_ID=MMETSP0014_2-20120614/36475_1 /TAXON_ID=2857 /ORGANISM="Nitzschia sp." /LENGTH=1167 /DNA_ID=CAMNT_0000403067 /DNA_START=213 /DNA_END=3716 /DNA_ORIENTATION=+ /assembly_acc=CAM_ASM_000159